MDIICGVNSCKINSLHETEGYPDDTNTLPSEDRVYIKSWEYFNNGVSTRYFDDFQGEASYNRPSEYSFSFLVSKEVIEDEIELVKVDSGVELIVDYVTISKDFDEQGNRINIGYEGSTKRVLISDVS